MAEAGAELQLLRMPADEMPEDIDGYDGLVCLGGGMGAQDDTAHPWLADVRRLLARAAARDVPTLGVCLGAQLLAVATGGSVVPGDRGPEAGPGLVSKKDAAWTDPLFADLPLLPDVLQFHADAIETLPGQAELLASSPQYRNQAFRLNRRVYGIQFHIETTPEVVLDWVANAPKVAAAAKAGAFDRQSLVQAHADLAQTWRPFAHRFADLVAGRLEPANRKPRSLPLT
ncbi:GMP synthase-like glutamine amidotransferase [Saccharomonospora amisosensis]|uniref:GMP synthase-like glutamine amidotransferase n=1 Tax=Saccharomonospora amisosensis TaxID=1128677 RepID=A0A7X5ZSZ6_9PSEU|nr:GMP synthase-like glutamine amidotransferase [Saccharomonospora amisosensis]